MAHIATKRTETHLFELHYNNGFELLTCTSGKKPGVRAVTIGEAKQFYDRADEKAEKFNADGYEAREYIKMMGGPAIETQESIERRKRYEMPFYGNIGFADEHLVCSMGAELSRHACHT